MILHKTPWWIRAFYTSLTWTGTPYVDDRPTVYLTFDDGPVPDITPWVAAILQQYNAKATFFCVGDNIAKHPEEYAHIRQAGHTTANHTFHHVNGWKTTSKNYMTEVEDCQKYLSTEPGGKPLFRPPYGKISLKQIKLLSPGYQIIMWDVLSADYDKRLSPRNCLKKTIKATRAGSIIVFHDSIKAEQNLRYVLPAFLEHFSGKGFAFNAL